MCKIAFNDNLILYNIERNLFWANLHLTLLAFKYSTHTTKYWTVNNVFKLELLFH